MNRRQRPSSIGTLVLAVAALAACHGTHETISWSYEETVITENSVNASLAAKLATLKGIDVPADEPKQFVESDAKIREICDTGASALESVDALAFAVLQCRMSLGEGAPKFLDKLVVRTAYIDSAKASAARMQAPAQRTDDLLASCATSLDDLRTWYATQLADPANTHGPAVSALNDALVDVDAAVAKYRQLWQSLVRLPLENVVSMLEAADPSTELGVAGATVAAQEELRVVLESLAELRGKKFEFKSKHTIHEH